jgi:hypothetical protein
MYTVNELAPMLGTAARTSMSIEVPRPRSTFPAQLPAHACKQFSKQLANLRESAIRPTGAHEHTVVRIIGKDTVHISRLDGLAASGEDVFDSQFGTPSLVVSRSAAWCHRGRCLGREFWVLSLSSWSTTPLLMTSRSISILLAARSRAPDAIVSQVMGHWQYIGRGHSPGEAIYARTIAADLAENRRLCHHVATTTN